MSAVAKDAKDVDFLCRHCLTRDLEGPFTNLLYDRLCTAFAVDPNRGALALQHSVGKGKARQLIPIVKWQDEKRLKVDFLLDVHHNFTYETTGYVPGNARKSLLRSAGLSAATWPQQDPDLYAIALVTHFYKWDPFYRYKLSKAFYGGMKEARDKMGEKFKAIEYALVSETHFGLAASGILFRYDGYLGFGLETHYYICDGTFEQRKQPLASSR